MPAKGCPFPHSWPLVSTQVPSLPTRNEWGENWREGDQPNAPPLPNPLLLPASGGEGEMLRIRAFLDLCRYQWASPVGSTRRMNPIRMRPDHFSVQSHQ